MASRKIQTSHTRTVVRECCKEDDESLWERGKFDPPPPKNPLTDGHQSGFPTRFLPKPKNRVTRAFFQNRKTGFWLPGFSVLNFYLQRLITRPINSK